MKGKCKKLQRCRVCCFRVLVKYVGVHEHASFSLQIKLKAPQIAKLEFYSSQYSLCMK